MAVNIKKLFSLLLVGFLFGVSVGTVGGLNAKSESIFIEQQKSASLMHEEAVVNIQAVANSTINPGAGKLVWPILNAGKDEDIPLPLRESKQYADNMIAVYIQDEERVIQINEEEYLVGVVAAEMPASYQEEALKAQAVAARTYLERKKSASGCNRHAQADICTSSGHCQAYRDEKNRRQWWGKKFDYYEQKIRNAVQETKGEVLLYEGKLINAMYHSSSYGSTEDCVSVYGNQMDYLVSVPTPENKENVTVEVKINRSVLVKKLLAQLPDSGISETNLNKALKLNGVTPSGRVDSVTVGNCEISASRFRGIVGLRSTDFSMRIQNEEVIFIANGHGHGLGMSQAGANILAKQGMNYYEILLHYYKGVILDCPKK